MSASPRRTQEETIAPQQEEQVRLKPLPGTLSYRSRLPEDEVERRAQKQPGS